MDYKQAANYYSQAAARGHVRATHRLAHLSVLGKGVKQSCQNAVVGFKAVAERGDWVADFHIAHKKVQQGEK